MVNSEPDITPLVLNYKKTANSTDPLVNFQINNPIPPIKRLLKRLFSNEEITIKIPILTAIAIVAFGLGGASGFLTAVKTHIASKVPIVNEIFPTPVPTVEPTTWVHDTLFGTLSKQVSGNYFLIQEGGNVVKLIAPLNVNLEKLVGKKILAQGQYNMEIKEMKVDEASDLLLFSSTAPVPTISPTPEATQAPVPSPTVISSPIETVEPTF